MLVTMLPLKKIVVAHVAKFLWNEPFTSEELKNMNNDKLNSWEIKLSDHLQKTISASNIYVEKNRLPLVFKDLFKESIHLLYQSYRRMLLWTIVYYVKSDIDLLKEGELFAPNYFTVDGEFDHHAWAKRFVLDPTYKISDRFNLACFYWFENETAALWSEMKKSNSVPCKGDLKKIKDALHPIITLRIFQLEAQVGMLLGADNIFQLGDHLDVLERGRSIDEIFRRVVLRTAAQKGFEYAAQHFWNKMSEMEKKAMIESHWIFELISVFIEYPYAKISLFFYSLLSKERKKEFLDWTVTCNEEEKYLTLLHCASTKPIRSEIIEFVHQLPTRSLNYVLDFSACRIRGLKLPIDIEIFQMLWYDLPPKKRDALRKGFIIECFVEAKAFSFLECIIKRLSTAQKDKHLLEYYRKDFITMEGQMQVEYGNGVRCLNILSKAGEYDFISKYLSFFLVENDPLTQKEILRKDACVILQKFIETPHFARWCAKISKSKLSKVNVQIDALLASLTLLNEVCEAVDEQN